jgi:hypothetical protein
MMRYLGPRAPKAIALSVASVSGALLAVCSCTVLPLFGGIYKWGAGLSAAIAFLYSGPAINIMAVVVTAKVLGAELGLAPPCRYLICWRFAQLLAQKKPWFVAGS